MFFEKPDVRYVDMCIYIDDHIYTGNYDTSKVYQYIYHIVMMISLKRNYFQKNSDLDDFCLYAASVYYMRLTDSRQFDDGNKIEKIRSILNYIKKTLFSIRRDYCKKYVNEKDLNTTEVISVDANAVSMYINRVVDPITRVEFRDYIGDLRDTIRQFLKGIPFKYGTVMWGNIYISCMLSFLNSITLKNRDIRRIKEFKRPNSLNDELITKLYLNEKYNSTILYHLDDSMYNYITVLTNRVRHKLANDLSNTLHEYVPSQINIKNLLMSETLNKQGW